MIHIRRRVTHMHVRACKKAFPVKKDELSVDSSMAHFLKHQVTRYTRTDKRNFR